MNKNLTTLFLSLLLLVSCQHPNPLPIPQVPALPDGWSKVELGDGTKCAGGDSYYFWVRPGTENKLVIFFQGGGLCWDNETCWDKRNDCVDCDSESTTSFSETGILDIENVDNPFSSYYFVVIPYCTADLHWGDKEKTYVFRDQEFIVQHKGFINGQSVLKWVYTHFSKPESILVAGSSAGSYGAILHSDSVIKRYPTSKVVVLSDSGAIFPKSYDFDCNYNALQNFPLWVFRNNNLDSGVASPGFDLVRFYIAMAKHHPNSTYALVNFANDLVQYKTYRDIEGEVSGMLIIENLEKIQESGLGNLKVCTLSGFLHVILTRNNYFPMVKDWVFGFIEGEGDLSCGSQ